jgi:hypothetical protein
MVGYPVGGLEREYSGDSKHPTLFFSNNKLKLFPAILQVEELAE